jgi:hypothetical protein
MNVYVAKVNGLRKYKTDICDYVKGCEARKEEQPIRPIWS